MENRSKRLGIACGDPAGIGPEIALKAVARQLSTSRDCFVLYGDPSQLTALNESLQLRLPLTLEGATEANARVQVRSDASIPSHAIGTPSLPTAEGARAAMAWLTQGARGCLVHELDALITAPVSKAAIVDAGFTDFVGQTEYLSGLAGVQDTVMMLLGHDDRDRWLRVALATIHVPLKNVATTLTRRRVDLAIERATAACLQLGLPRRRVAVCGLNPHAGEGGKMGREEMDLIRPAVLAASERGFDVHGPFPADTLFHQVYRGDYDAVVAMYHDQGLTPLKMVAFESGVNWTLGLPFIRTSPDHGTAFDIAGKGVASPESMLCAIRLARQLAIS